MQRKKKKPVHTAPAATADEIRKALGIRKRRRPKRVLKGGDD